MCIRDSVTLFHFSVLVKMDHVFRADLFAGMTSNTFFFVCQYKSSLRIFVNCLHRTGFDTDTAVITARTDIPVSYTHLAFGHSTRSLANSSSSTGASSIPDAISRILAISFWQAFSTAFPVTYVVLDA